ncbi:hypothetical protein H2509_12720 [Stappia sp. F7233]|uniref:Lipoprotein n=1 Tax=Stappia albiluteola TaxID=2758565 RepID=A0A839AGV8_9HYPH|nr:hypothetical protein [Stappia albiluteola]MBA5777987.1 hypothetical protein [Stappia albiluteola]
MKTGNWSRLFGVVIACTVLTGCITAERARTLLSFAERTTQEDKKLIINYFRNNYNDPYSIRDAEISDTIVGLKGRKMICVYLNSKNSFGAYAGRKLVEFNLVYNRIIWYWEDQNSCQMLVNHGLKLHPFPEAERI